MTALYTSGVILGYEPRRSSTQILTFLIPLPAIVRMAARASCAVETSFTACSAVVPLSRTASGPPLGGAMPGMKKNRDAGGNFPARWSLSN